MKRTVTRAYTMISMNKGLKGHDFIYYYDVENTRTIIEGECIVYGS